MNKKALETLEYHKIKEAIKSMAISELGQQMVQNIEPCNDIQRISLQLKEINEAKSILNTASAVPLQNMSGIEGLLDKLGKCISFNTEDLTNISTMLSGIKRLINFMAQRQDIAPMVSSYASSMYPLEEVIDEIDTCIHNNRIEDQASITLEKVRKKIYIVEGRLKSKLENMVKSQTIKKYLQDQHISMKNNRYVLSVKSEYRQQIQGSVIAKSSTGSTLFIEPTSIGQMQGELELLKIDEEKEIYQILMYLTSLIEEHKAEIQLNIETLTYYDFIFAKAKYSQSINGRSAKLNYKGYTNIINGRHPLLGKDAIPLNFTIGEDYKVLVITGPNTGGKTVVLKTVGLLTTMIQSGIHIPVDQGSTLAIYSDILVDIGDGQNIEQSLSTFSSHITNIIDIMNSANQYTLVLLDEVGAGTDPMEGEGLAVAILEDLYDKKATIVSTSHYGEVKEFATTHNGFKNGKMLFNLETLRPTYILEIGKPGESNAFIIALRLGMKQDVIEKAHHITYDETKDYSTMIKETKKTIPVSEYKKAKRPKAIKKQVEITNKKEKQIQQYKIGDVVFIHSLNQRGIVFDEINKKQEIGVKIKDKKIYIPVKRVSLFIEREQLYPDANNYDYTIVTETVDYRKKNHQMNRKFQKNMEIVHEKGHQ